MKWIQELLWKIQSGHEFVHRQTDGQMDGQTDGQTDGQVETNIPTPPTAWCGGYNGHDTFIQ